MGKSSGSGSTSTTTVQKSDPWSGVQPYLTGTRNITGIYPEANNLYNSSGWNSDMQSLTNNYLRQIANRSNSTANAQNIASGLMNGQYNTSISPVSNISGVGDINMSSALSSMGATDPTNALSSILSGQVDTSTLDPVVQSAQSKLADTFNQSTLPTIGRSATAAGQYGSSRQGIAEGLAAQGLANAQGDIATNLYNSAYQNAQNNQSTAANNLSSLGLSAATTNNANNLATQQYNASLGLHNNAQALTQASQNVTNYLNGLNALGTANTMQDTNYNNALSALQAGNAYNWKNLSNYANIIGNTSGLGGSSSSTSSTPTTSNYGASVAGGALGGYALSNALGLSNPYTAALTIGGGLLGLL